MPVVTPGSAFDAPRPAAGTPATTVGTPRRIPTRGPSEVTAATDPDEADDDELGDEEDLAVSQPLADEDSAFDDFDDEFDDDFEEEENDPDWDHPDDGDAEPPPPAKGGGGRKK